MPRKITPSFIAEFPLSTAGADDRALRIRLDAERQLYNASLGESLRRLKLIRDSRDWKTAQAMPKTLGKDDKGKPIPNKERAGLFGATQDRFGFTSASIQKFAETCRDACWIGDHTGSHDTQTTSLRAFKAVQMHAFGKRARPRFKTKGRLHSVEGKADSVIRFRTDPVPAVHWNGLVLPVRFDLKDKRGWQADAMSRRTKYVRILHRTVRGRVRWFCQLVQEGLAPQLHVGREGVVGLDVGPSTIAVVSSADALLEQFCPEVIQPWKETRRLQRAMDRSRRAINPGNYNPNRTVKKGPKTWVRSNRYEKVRAALGETERTLAATRKKSQGGLANRVLAQGTTIKTEAVSYLSFQKNFGRSVKVRAPGKQIEIIRRKAESAGGAMIDIKIRTTKLSQFDHSTRTYVKKPLSQRIHVFGDGQTAPVQRDLYSAFLATCCDQDSLDVLRVDETWTAAEPLLRRAMSRKDEPARGKGHARPHAPCVGAGRPSKREGRSIKAVDVVAKARATKSSNNGTLGTPCL